MPVSNLTVFAARRSNSFYSGNCHRIRVGRTNVRGKRFSTQLNSSKEVRDRLYVSMADYRMGQSPTPYSINWGPRSTPFQHAAKRFKIDENDNNMGKFENTFSDCEVMP